MLAVTFGEITIGALIILISILLIGLVLLQKNRGSGLSGAFGGVGGHSAFGTKTGDFLTWFTVSLAALFLILCVAGNFVFEPEKSAAARAKAANAAQATQGNANTSATNSDAAAGGETKRGAATDAGAENPAPSGDGDTPAEGQ